MALTKKEIARSIQGETGSTYDQAYQSMEAAFEILKETLASGEDVMISGFGKFKVNEKVARKGRNPATGEEIKIPAKTVVKMRLLKGCTEAILPPKKK